MVRNIKELLRRDDGAELEVAGLDEPAGETCISCGASLRESRLYEAYRVCHACGFHFHLTARERVALLLDPGTFHEADRGVTAIDPISFSGRQAYRARVIDRQRRTGLAESALTGTGRIFGRDVVVAALDYAFMGGSIGVVSGERLARAFEKATNRGIPLISITSTSGTRMQEGILALLQLPRVVAAVNRHRARGLPHISILTDPTTGSGYAGFASLGDYILAEPNALVGYAAMRVLQEQGPELPPGAHTSESHYAHGLADCIVPRPQMRDQVGLLLDLLVSDYRLSAPRESRDEPGRHTPRAALAQLELSRHAQRPTSRDFIERMTASFMPIHGDRMGEDDPSIIAGFASLGGEAVMVVGQERPQGALDAWIGPTGFRKARRAFDLAARFGLPVVTLVDTAGAHPGLESEGHGLGVALATCLATFLDLPVPTLAVITGEGSSEAAAAMAAADVVLMLDNAVYEVVRPEDAARILYQEAGRASEVAERLRITSHDCLRLGIIDGTVPEPAEGAHANHQEAALLLRRAIMRELAQLQGIPPKKRLEQRYARYRGVGSTRSWLRGTAERRLAHLFDRLWAIWDRIRGRGSELRRRQSGEANDIPV